MPRCKITVEGQTLELDAVSLNYAAIGYNCAQVCGFAREYPKLEHDTELTVQVEGRSEVHRIVWRDVLEWANRVAAENARKGAG